MDTNISSLFLVSTGVFIGVLIGAIVVVGAGAFLIGYFLNKKRTEKKVGEVSQRIQIMLDEAENECKALKKEAILEAKEQDLKLRNEFERESREKKAELAKSEQRLLQKEDNLDKKEDALQKRSDQLEQQQKNLVNRENEKKILIDNILEDARHDAAVQVRNIEQEAKDEADAEAKKIISLAIQRCASDQASELTVSVVPLPNDDMKARIIGREGRNIRALENATGVELIIDDTPEVVIVSGFDPVRREVARISLEKLIGDGRIHPARIEETVEKVRKELDVQIKENGEAAAFEVGVFGLHPEIIKLLGRLRYRTSYGQNVYKHSIEVAQLAGLMASELGLDVNLAKRAGLLHDIGKAVDHEQEGTHIQIGADLAKKYKENANVVNAIMAHHGDVEPKTVEAVLVQAADAISGARPGARRETSTNYVKRLEQLEGIASSFKGVDKSYAIQAGREVRVIVKPEQIDDSQAMFLAKDIAKKIEQELEYPGQIKVNVIREFRSVEYAK